MPSPKPIKKSLNSFFAGIGGFDLAFKKNGFSTAYYCENNTFCRSVLKRHWPNAPNAGDIGKIDPQSIPLADIWIAGFPCQDLSLARTPHGHRKGLKGTRSGLFFTFLELLSIHKPQCILLENVAGLLNSHKGADFKIILNSLTQLGYAVAWRVLNARHFGVPQSRPRVFICAWLNSPEKATSVLFEQRIPANSKGERQGFIIESKCPNTGISVPQVSFCISATSGRHTGLDWARTYVTYPNSVRRLTPLECERLQGFPDGWTLPDDDYVIPIRGLETNRYHAIGNAVCVPVAAWIAARISKVLKDPTQISCDVNGKVNLLAIGRKILSPNISSQDLAHAEVSSQWKSGGLAFETTCVTAPISSSPCTVKTSNLIDIIDKTEKDQRYFLSSNAMIGILRRVDKQKRHLFPPLDAKLRDLTTIAAKSEQTPCGSNRSASQNKIAI